MNWCRKTRTLSTLLGGTLKIIHPELHALGRSALNELRDPGSGPLPWFIHGEDIRLGNVLEEWLHPFSAVSVIVNRTTPCHRDSKGRNSWMDILATVGDYSFGRLELPGLGVRLEYEPGTVVGLLGKVVRHGASEVVGERMCLAYYMRDKVHQRLGVPAGTWMNVDTYQ